MKALISKIESSHAGYRVAQVVTDDQTFPVSSYLFWVNCDDDVEPDQFWYDPTDQRIKPKPPVTNNIYEYIPVNSVNNDITLVVHGTYSNVTILSQPSHGEVMTTGCSIFYTPNKEYVGEDEFVYTTMNVGGISNTATVNVIVSTSSTSTEIL
jgi:hypothetical protein